MLSPSDSILGPVTSFPVLQQVPLNEELPGSTGRHSVIQLRDNAGDSRRGEGKGQGHTSRDGLLRAPKDVFKDDTWRRSETHQRKNRGHQWCVCVATFT